MLFSFPSSIPQLYNSYSQFGVYEWCMTDKWDPAEPSHVALQHEIELGNGIPEMRPIATARAALQTVGFTLEHDEDLAERPDVVPWYYPLEGDVRKAQTFWDYLTVLRISPLGKVLTHNAVWVMELLGMVPKGTHSVGEALKVAAVSLVQGGQLKVCSLRYNLRRSDVLADSDLHADVSGSRAQTAGEAELSILAKHGSSSM